MHHPSEKSGSQPSPKCVSLEIFIYQGESILLPRRRTEATGAGTIGGFERQSFLFLLVFNIFIIKGGVTDWRYLV
jgi:hypothetical protein